MPPTDAEQGELESGTDILFVFYKFPLPDRNHWTKYMLDSHGLIPIPLLEVQS